MEKNIQLNNGWFYTNSFEYKYLEKEFDYSNLEKVDLPHSSKQVSEQYFDSDEIVCQGAYFKEFHLPNSYSDNQIFLCLDGILGQSIVYVNSKDVNITVTESSYSLDITDYVNIGGDNLLVIAVDSRPREEMPFSGGMDSVVNYGGIYRGISLSVVSKKIIKDVYVKPINVLEKEVELDIDVAFTEVFPDHSISAEIFNYKSERVALISTKKIFDKQLTLKGSVNDVILWDLDNPVLYKAVINVYLNGEVVGTKTVPFGFRKIEFKRQSFYLNSKAVKLIGLNYHDSYPCMGRAMPQGLQIKDAHILKYDLGVNVIRVQRFVSKEFIAECDKIGLLVITDLAGDGYIGNDKWRSGLLDIIKDKINLYKNSPSIIAWGARVNNSNDYDEFYFKTNSLIKKLDSLRPSIGSRDFMGSRLDEDIFGFNDYPKDKNIVMSKRTKTGKLLVPYIITEHTGKNHVVKPFDNEQIKLQQALNHLKIIDIVLGSSGVSGAIGMSYADFNAVNSKGSGDNINYYGVMDMYRNPKLSFYSYASQFSKNDVLELSSDLSSDEFTGKLYVFTNADYIKFYRNGEEAGTFYPNNKEFKNLKHPPIIIEDFSGNLEKSEKMSKLQAGIVKKLIAKTYNKSIYNLSLADRLSIFALKKSLNLSNDKFHRLLDEYSLDKSKSTIYKIESYKNDKLVLSKEIGRNIKNGYIVEYDKDKIVVEKGFEVRKITVKHLNALNNPLSYDFEPIDIVATGAIRLIGNSKRTLNSGIVSFYIKTVKQGIGTVVINYSNGKKDAFDMEVEYAGVERL